MSWNQFNRFHLLLEDMDFSLDVGQVGLTDEFLREMEEPMQAAFDAMQELESGAIANPDEGRMVGHYWLRDPDLAPSADIGRSIRKTLEEIKSFVTKVHNGELAGEGGAFRNVLVVGIGGSALGPQFVSEALGHPASDRLGVFFFDNTDPDGIDLTLARLEGELGQTLVLVISKSGGTPETRNGMLEAAAAYQREGLSFARHAVAVTGENSGLDKTAVKEGWLARFPMWDWVGGRTSETGPVGLLPAALQGLDIDAFLSGAMEMDDATRSRETFRNPAALLALTWYFCTNGRGEKDMVVLPYKDRLSLFSKYLQQLIMESLGKEKDLQGNVVHQGITVYGNKGSTDQHAYVQQLREGVANFFALFIQVLRCRSGESIEVEPGVTAGDYLHGFMLGTREALAENGRPSALLTILEVTPAAVGRLIALFERSVGLYAHLVGINAYHQPGVEAGKKAAGEILALQKKLLDWLADNPDKEESAAGIADHLGIAGSEERIFRILEQCAINRPDVVAMTRAADPAGTVFYSAAQ